MIAFLLVLCVAQAQAQAQAQPAQLLSAAQHAAWMSVADAIGCNSSMCPRFSATQSCAGKGLVCDGTDVKSM